MLHSQSFPLGQPSRSSGNHTVSYHIMTIAFVQMSSSSRLTGLSTRTPEEFACSHECPQPPTFCFLPSGDAPAAPSHRLRGPHTARSLCGLPVLTPDTADPPRILTGQFWLPAACALLNPAPPLSLSLSHYLIYQLCVLTGGVQCRPPGTPPRAPSRRDMTGSCEVQGLVSSVILARRTS